MIQSLILYIILFTACKGNIWDNTFSHNSGGDQPLVDQKFTANYEIKQFSFLHLRSTFQFNGDKNKMSITFTPIRKELTLFRILIDFDNLVVQLNKGGQTCWMMDLPESAKIDLSDIKNIWRVTTFAVDTDKDGNTRSEFDVSEFVQILHKLIKRNKEMMNFNIREGYDFDTPRKLMIVTGKFLAPENVILELIDKELDMNRVGYSPEVEEFGLVEEETQVSGDKIQCFKGVDNFDLFIKEVDPLFNQIEAKLVELVINRVLRLLGMDGKPKIDI